MSRVLLSCLGLGAAAALTFTGGSVVGAFAGGLGGNLATDFYKFLHRSVAERFLDGWSDIDENHHVSRALRFAQIDGLRAVLKRFDAGRAGDPDPARHREAGRFSSVLKDFLDRATKAAQGLAFSGGADVSAEEQTIRMKVLQTLPDGFDQGLATRRATGDRSAMLESLKQVRVAVEAAVLEEIRLQTLAKGEDFPPLFRALFEGKGQPDGWFDLFVRDAAAKIKDGTEFEQIWNAEQTALIKAIVAAHSAVLDRIDERTDRTDRRTELMQHDLAELLALARSGGAYQRAAEQGISEAAVRKIVERLGGEGIGQDDLIPWLDNWIEAATRELGRQSNQSNEGEAFETAWREAEKRFKAGRVSEASAAFMEELDREAKREAERQHEHKRRQIRLLEGAIRFDALAFNAPAIIPKLRLMANIEGVDGGDALGEWLMAKAEESSRQGKDKGSNPDLVAAISTYCAALEERTRDRVPLDWAATQNNLGNALRTLGEREVGTARLEEAVEAYRAALEERTRDRVPLDWAATQNNLGVVLQALSEREAGTARLKQAVEAYRAALKEYTRDRVPLDWAATQNNLGSALRTLGEREGETARLEEAVAAYRAALEERTRDRVPLDWAATQMNLGNALLGQGEREAGTARLEEALAAYEACLTVIVSVLPSEWIEVVRFARDRAQAEITRRSTK